MGSSQPWIDTAQKLIKDSREAEQPIWLDRAVKDILDEHPHCGLTKTELADVVRQLVIEQRWALDGG
jgi:hypothetical protein